MKRGMGADLALKGAEALAWFVHVWVLVQMLPSSELGRVLYALAFANCIGALLTVGWARWLQSSVAEGRDAASAWSAAVAGLAARCLVALPIMALVSGQVGGKLLYPLPELPVLMAVIACLFSLLRLCGFALSASAQRSRATALTGALPILLATGGVLLAAEARPLSVDVVLGVHALSLLTPLVLAARQLPRLCWSGDLPQARVFVDSMVQSGMLLFRNLDIMVIGLVLSPVEAAIYLIVRAVALLLDMVYRGLGRALLEPIALSYRSRDRARFVAQTARANLGFLLIGGAGALLLFLATGPVIQVFGLPMADARLPLIYLIIAQSAPAIFGATHLVMTVTGLDRARAWVVWAAMPLALILIFSAARDGLPSLAATYAALQIGIAAICAVVVALHCGIWPGLTAVFHSRIRLR